MLWSHFAAFRNQDQEARCGGLLLPFIVKQSILAFLSRSHWLENKHEINS